MNFKKASLDFSNKKLTELPDGVFTTKRLYKLDLSKNNLKNIPKEIANLKQLETLDLSDNQIKQFPAKLCELPNLKILILNNNEIVSIPKQISQLKKLQILGLANNMLETFSHGFAELPRLKELNLSMNLIEDFPYFDIDKPFPSLKALWLSHNPLTKLSQSDIVEGMPSLRAIYLFSSRLENPLAAKDIRINSSAALQGNSIKELKRIVTSEDYRKLRERKKQSAKENNETMPAKNDVERKNKIFISYAHDDDDSYLKLLKKHLKVLGDEESFELWDDSRIRASQEWRVEIAKALVSCTAAILLVSISFLASDFIQKDELPPLLEAAEKKGTRIFPVIIEPCPFSKSSISRFQAANSPAETLSEVDKPKQNRVFMKLIDDIQHFMKEK